MAPTCNWMIKIVKVNNLYLNYDAFRLPIVNFLREFYKLTLNAYIYKPLLTAIAGANDHKGLAGPTSRNKQSYDNYNFFFRQGERYILGATVLAENF